MVNDFVYGTLGWQTYFQGKPDHPAVQLEHRQIGGSSGGRDVDHLGLFGSSGMTAYFGMFDVGRLKDGDRVVVSGAAGSVGLVCALFPSGSIVSRRLSTAVTGGMVKSESELSSMADRTR